MRQLILATTTPLASIFGSGFLVIVPILAGAVGQWSVYAMAGICAVAFMVGEVIRYNIKHVEPALKGTPTKAMANIERLSDIALIVAYVISVCLYLHILSAFVLTGLSLDTPFNENLLTTLVIVFITLVGVIKGLTQLEGLEKWALYITLAIILILCFVFAQYDFAIITSEKSMSMPAPSEYSPWQVMTILAGTLIVVQGFETSRYLGNTYNAEIRIASSRFSQVIATLVYLSFVALTLPSVHLLEGQYNDHSLIDLVGFVSAIFVVPLILAATLSQFSAAVADTLAAAGNISELTKDKINEKRAYIIIGIGAIILTWTADTFTVLALASRAFAFYYFLQCLVALTVPAHPVKKMLFVALSLVLAFITVFAVPVG